MCFLRGPSPEGAGCKTRLESRIKKFKPHFVCRPKRAAALFDQGITGLGALKTAVAQGRVQLTSAETIGLRHVKDFASRIPRAEMKRIAATATQLARDLDPQITVTVCGSFRRGAASSGDIDMLISHPNFTAQARTGTGMATSTGSAQHGTVDSNPLQAFVKALVCAGLITDTLSNGASKFQGVCRVDAAATHRRIDIMASNAYIIADIMASNAHIIAGSLRDFKMAPKIVI